MANSSNAEHRAHLILGIEGVAEHDELLVKSLIRLLNYRTQHDWSFGADTGAADLRILGENAPPMADNQNLDNVLWVGHSKQPHQTPFLHLPIHADEFELQLNTLGENLLKKQAEAHKGWPAPIQHDETFMLQRWPPASMLGTAMRIKLATLMTGRSLSIDTLAQRSGATIHDCEQFCQMLNRASLLQRSVAEPQAQPAQEVTEHPVAKARPEMSLLLRIRRRLGI